MQFLIDNYLILIIVGLFIIFALIGYLIDNLKDNKSDNYVDNKIYEKIDEIEVKDKIKNIETITEKTQTKVIQDKADELLESYNNVNLE